jgi:hypothetical protein
VLACLLACFLFACFRRRLPVHQRGCYTCALLWCCCAGKSFGFVGEDLAKHRITDDQLVQCFKGRTNVAFVFLNGCGTTSVCRRLQLECGIPVVLGWDDDEVPLQQQLAMVRVCMCESDVGGRWACARLTDARRHIHLAVDVWCGVWCRVCGSRTCSCGCCPWVRAATLRSRTL